MCAMKHTGSDKHALWSKGLESVRKDVQCLFGMLKGRFRILKTNILYKDSESINSVYFTFCVLHNMLLSF